MVRRSPSQISQENVEIARCGYERFIDESLARTRAID
jgi:hypothetical protein